MLDSSFERRTANLEARDRRWLRELVYGMLRQRGAIDAIPAMLDREPELAARMSAKLRQVIDAVGVHGSVAQQRVRELQSIFEAFLERHSRQKGASDDHELEAVGSARHRSARGQKHA